MAWYPAPFFLPERSLPRSVPRVRSGVLTVDGLGGIDALPVGTVLLAKEGKPVAGRVFSVAAGGTAGQLEVDRNAVQ